MRSAGVERHHHLRLCIAGVEFGDLHADRRIGEAGVLAFEFGNLLVVGEHRDDRHPRGLAILALLLEIAQHRPYRPL